MEARKEAEVEAGLGKQGPRKRITSKIDTGRKVGPRNVTPMMRITSKIDTGRKVGPGNVTSRKRIT